MEREQSTEISKDGLGFHFKFNIPNWVATTAIVITTTISVLVIYTKLKN